MVIFLNAWVLIKLPVKIFFLVLLSRLYWLHERKQKRRKQKDWLIDQLNEYTVY